jgi:hypothetical protein
MALIGLLIGGVTGYEYENEHSQDPLGYSQETIEELERKWGFEVCSFFYSYFSL